VDVAFETVLLNGAADLGDFADEAAAEADFLDFFFFFFLLCRPGEKRCQRLKCSRYNALSKGGGKHLLPTPYWLETVKESNILEKVWEEPEPWRNHKDSHAE
jgi:hypothetical protein